MTEKRVNVRRVELERAAAVVDEKKEGMALEIGMVSPDLRSINGVRD
jgi:hypothetical protein